MRFTEALLITMLFSCESSKSVNEEKDQLGMGIEKSTQMEVELDSIDQHPEVESVALDKTFDIDFVRSHTSEVTKSIKINISERNTGIDLEFLRQKLSKHKIDIGYPEYLPTDFENAYSFKGFREYPNFNLFTLTHQNEYCCNTLYAITTRKDTLEVINIAVIGFYGGDGGWHGEEFGEWVNDTTINTILVSFYDDDLVNEESDLTVDSTWITYTIDADGAINQFKTDSVTYVGAERR